VNLTKLLNKLTQERDELDTVIRVLSQRASVHSDPVGQAIKLFNSRTGRRRPRRSQKKANKAPSKGSSKGSNLNQLLAALSPSNPQNLQQLRSETSFDQRLSQMLTTLKNKGLVKRTAEGWVRL
jgi:hypothetical protein